MPIVTRECLACQFRFEVLSLRGEMLGLHDTDAPICPKCKSEASRPEISAGTGIMLGGAGGEGKHFPHYNKALGCWVESAQHLRKLEKQLGVECTHGAAAFDEREFSRRKTEEDKAIAEHEAMVQRVRDDNEQFGEFRKNWERDHGRW